MGFKLGPASNKLGTDFNTYWIVPSIPYDDVTITGTPTITEVTTSDLVIDNVAVETSAISHGGRSVAANRSVRCTIAPKLNVTGRRRLRLNYVTSDSLSRETLEGEIMIKEAV